jgi:hypothetical protein
MKRPARLVALDRVDLLVIGAEAGAIDPDEVVDGVDLMVLARLEARLAVAPSLAAAAAEALITIAGRRPFRTGNRPAAWLAAAHLAALNGRSLDLAVDDAVRLVDGAASGALDRRAVTALLAEALGDHAVGRARRLATRLAARAATLTRTRERPRPPVRVCPLCQRTVSDGSLWLGGPWMVVPRDDLIRGCVRQHGAHDHEGRPVPAVAPPVDDRSAPLVHGSVGDDDAFVALTRGGPVLLRPDAGPEPDHPVTYEVVPLSEVSVSSLVGPWDRLAARHVPVARVAVGDGSLRADQALLDWSDVRALTGTGSWVR